MLLSGRNPFPGNTKERVKELIVKSSVDLNVKEFRKVTNNAKDFISKALNKKIKARYSAADLLNHPWLVDVGTKQMKEIKKEDSVEILQNL